MAEPSLLEISLLVDGELAEAVAEVMSRFIPNGVVIESTQIAPDPHGEGYVVGPLRVCGYLPANTQLDALRQKLEEALWYLGRISPLPEPHFRYIEETNWVEAWKEHYHPIPIGQRLLIIPAWLDTPLGDRVAVRIDPGMAFGTGTHPTTQLCLDIAEQAMPPNARIIDIGCGSGILSIAALKLGASHALAVDIDPLAVQASQHNAALNQVSQQLELGVASVAEIKTGHFSIHTGQLVFANILAPILERLFSDGLGDLIAPGGIGILSGILEEQASGVEAAAQAHGYAVTESRQSGDWVALGVRRVIA